MACGILCTPKHHFFHQRLSGLLTPRHRDEVFVRALTRRYSRPHDKEHPHCNPLQGGGQKATLLQDGVYDFILQGNQQEDEHCIKHGEPGSWEAERQLVGVNKGAGKTGAIKEKNTKRKQKQQIQTSGPPLRTSMHRSTAHV